MPCTIANPDISGMAKDKSIFISAASVDEYLLGTNELIKYYNHDCALPMFPVLSYIEGSCMCSWIVPRDKWVNMNDGHFGQETLLNQHEGAVITPRTAVPSPVI